MALWIPPPSFSRSIARASRDRPFAIARRLIGKVQVRELLERLDVPLPGDFEEVGGIADLTPAMLDRPRVLKPRVGSNNRGFLPLEPQGRGRWRDVLHDTILDFDDVRRVLAGELVTHGFDDSWIAEELLLGPAGGIPDDVKFLAFRDHVAGGFVRANSPKGFWWFDGDWTTIDPGLANHRLDPAVQAPADRDSYRELARTIAAALPIPFVRVDLLATSRGPVVGELTPFPGWAHDLAPAYDVAWGRLYEGAETQLLSHGMDWDAVTGDPRLAGWAARGEVAR